MPLSLRHGVRALDKFRGDGVHGVAAGEFEFLGEQDGSIDSHWKASVTTTDDDHTDDEFGKDLEVARERIIGLEWSQTSKLKRQRERR